MKKTFKDAEIKIIRFEAESDVITSSIPAGTGSGKDDTGD